MTATRTNTLPQGGGQATQKPLVVVWRVLDKCNLSCPFCAYDKRLEFPRKQADWTEVSRVIGLLGELQRQSGRPCLISWLGGEPTLWKALPDAVSLARENGLSQSLTTNGTTLGSPRQRKSLIDGFAEVTISVDGFSDVHDTLRGWRNAFEKLRTSVLQLRRERDAAGSGLKIRANIVLMRRNIGRFAALCRELADWGVQDITFNQLGGRDRPEFYPHNRLRPEDVTALRDMLPDLRRKLASTGTTLLGGDPYVQRIAQTSRDVRLPVAACGVARDFWFIDETGVIAPCNFVEGDFGLKTTDLADVQAFAGLGDRLCAIQRDRPSPACANCMSTQQFSKFAA